MAYVRNPDVGTTPVLRFVEGCLINSVAKQSEAARQVQFHRTETTSTSVQLPSSSRCT